MCICNCDNLIQYNRGNPGVICLLYECGVVAVFHVTSVRVWCCCRGEFDPGSGVKFLATSSSGRHTRSHRLLDLGINIYYERAELNKAFCSLLSILWKKFKLDVGFISFAERWY